MVMYKLKITIDGETKTEDFVKHQNAEVNAEAVFEAFRDGNILGERISIDILDKHNNNAMSSELKEYIEK